MRTDQHEIIYQIDHDDLLVFFNDQWDLFAKDNDGHNLSGQNIHKKSIWDFICDAETRHLHETLLRRVRSNNTALNLPFRCDAPTLRRFMEMSIAPLANGNIEYRCRIIKTEFREAVPVSVGNAGSSASFLRMCSWCKKIDVGNNSWLEIEDAIKLLGLFSGESLPQISHTMCDPCMGSMDGD